LKNAVVKAAVMASTSAESVNLNEAPSRACY
jgi:hypothetical protein